MKSEGQIRTVIDLVKAGVLWVEDGNHGENRPLAGEFDSVGTPFIRPDDLKHGVVDFSNCDHVNETALKRIRKGKGKAGDIVFTHRATVGRIARVSHKAPDFVANPGVTVYRSMRAEVLDPNYLYYFMQGSFFMDQVWAEAGNTDTFPYVSLTQQRKLQIFLPSTDLQRSIGAALGTLDDRITLLRETNATLEAIAQALFKSWFVDFDPVRAKMNGRLPQEMDESTAALFPDALVESELGLGLGLVPEGWAYSRLAETCSYLNRGISPKYLEDGGVLVLNQKCIRDFSVDYAKGRRHDTAQRKIDGRELAKGDVLVNSTGVGTLGRVAQVLELPEPAIVDSHVTVVRAGSLLSWPYLGQWMAKVQPEIEGMGEGSTGQTELSRAKLGEMPILVPPKSVLTLFDKVIEPLKSRVALNERSARSLATLRDTLLPRLISGQLQIEEVAA